MKRRLLVVFLLFIISLNVSACSHDSRILEKNRSQIPETQSSVNKQVTPVNFNFDNNMHYILSKGCWYNEKSALLAFTTKPGEDQSLKLVSWKLDTGDQIQLYQDHFDVDRSDQMMINSKLIGYQSYLKAILFDANTLQVKQEAKAKAGAKICYSPNLEYLAEANDEGLYITNPQSQKTLLDNNSKGYLFLSWSSDNSKLLYMDNSYSTLGIIDVKSCKKQTLRAGEDFNVPDGWVDITSCRFLPESSDILIEILCENNEAIAVLRQADKYQSKIISDPNSITFMDASPGTILYLISDKSEYRLMRWDYLNDSSEIVYQVKEIIDSAFFSPGGDKIMFCTRDKQAQHFYLYQ
ncbi:MAG TPA: hypothetical protein VN426_05870 [Syntrophomonadaceae bacterium]|nr:hypothetical protein [Syntrophomonadaceae bacterium]